VATPGRTEDPGLDRWPVAEALDREPYRFDFFQAVRLLTRMRPEREPVGRFANPADEVARFAANPAVAFPASQIQSLERRDDAPARMAVNFMGLIGPLGVLPLPYSHLAIERLRAKDGALRDFFDLFHHRIISLFYQAWEKYRFAVPFERGDAETFSRHLLALVGLGTPGLENRQEVPDQTLLFYAGMLSGHARSAEGLRQVLTDYFQVPVEVEQFVGAWYPVEEDSRCELGTDEDYSGQLGLGAVVGDEVWDQQSRIRLRLGPLTMEEYQGFLPGGAAHRRLRSLATFYLGGEVDVEVQLVLKRRDVPACELHGADGPGPQLGWTAWVKNAEFARDPADTILELPRAAS
jgi:type VI secretion system protein ImpH